MLHKVSEGPYEVLVGLHLAAEVSHLANRGHILLALGSPIGQTEFQPDCKGPKNDQREPRNLLGGPLLKPLCPVLSTALYST